MERDLELTCLHVCHVIPRDKRLTSDSEHEAMESVLELRAATTRRTSRIEDDMARIRRCSCQDYNLSDLVALCSDLDDIIIIAG